MEQIKVEMKPAGLRMEADRQEVALAFKTWRLRAGLTQRQAAEKFGISRYTVMRVEAARDVTWETAYRVFAKLSAELAKEGKEVGNE